MRLIADITFQAGCPSDEAALNALHPAPSAGSHYIYIYSLAHSAIDYPNGAGTIICIGARSHLTSDMVSSYYYGGHRLRLQIYRWDASESDADPKSEENRLVAAHVKRYGSQPICQRTVGTSYATNIGLDPEFSADEVTAVALTFVPAGLSASFESIDTAP
jgi:hypothetical protein